MAAFALAAGVNTASVALQQRAACLTRWFGPRGWYVHLGVVLPFWAWFLALLPGLGRRVCWPVPGRLRSLGAPTVAIAGLLWLLAFKELGAARTGNANLFGHGSPEPVRGGVFRLLANPMYDSYALALLGVALQGGNGVYLLLAGESIVLLNGLEAAVENRPFAGSAERRWL